MSFARTYRKVLCTKTSERGKKRQQRHNGRKRNWKDYDENKGEENEES